MEIPVSPSEPKVVETQQIVELAQRKKHPYLDLLAYYTAGGTPPHISDKALNNGLASD